MERYGGVRLSHRPWQEIQGCYLSAFVSPPSDATRQIFASPADLDRYEAKIGKQLAISMVFLAWGHPGHLAPFPEKWATEMQQRRTVPHITWEPWDFDKYCQHYRNPKIVAGAWDDYIRSWAVAVRNWGHPIFFRWGHEMNAHWYPWAGGICPAGPQAFVAAFRHIVKIFRSEAADNVIWVWSPDTAIFSSQSPPFKYEPYYPGSDVVDWIAFDGYNFAQDSDATKPWVPFSDLYGDIYQRCQDLHPTAPFMIGEFACGEKGGSKAEWIRDAFQVIKTRMPRIKAVTWFDIDKESHWPVDSSPQALAAFRQAISDPYFIGKQASPQIWTI